MPLIAETRALRWSPEQMFALVADVKRYPEFLPWVVATRVRSDDGHEMIADMVVGFKALRESFASRVLKTPGEKIEVEYIDGPLKALHNLWLFHPDDSLAPGGCRIDFSVEFQFRSAIFETLAGQYLDRAFRKMVAAFETRAEKLYGAEAA